MADAFGFYILHTLAPPPNWESLGHSECYFSLKIDAKHVSMRCLWVCNIFVGCHYVWTISVFIYKTFHLFHAIFIYTFACSHLTRETRSRVWSTMALDATTIYCYVMPTFTLPHVQWIRISAMWFLLLLLSSISINIRWTNYWFTHGSIFYQNASTALVLATSSNTL